MAAVTTQAVVNGALTTPSPITASSSDTIARSQFGPNGVMVRVITSGTATNLTVSDPTKTGLGNAGTPPTLACPSTGASMTLVPIAAINSATDNATLNFSATTGVTYELYKV